MSGGNWKEMFQAACEGDIAMVKYHVKAGVDVDFAHFLLDSGANPGLWSEFDGMKPYQAVHQSGLKDVEIRLRAGGCEANPGTACAQEVLGILARQ